MSTFGVSTPHIIDGIMDRTQYIAYSKELPANVEKMQLGEDWIFIEEGDQKHKAYNIKMWFLYNTPEQFHVPPQSPDINPI